MGHVSRILPGINHFLSGLRCLHRRAKNRRSVSIPDRTQADCRMLLKFLEKANEGISLNLCSYRLPTIVCRSDSCPHGLHLKVPRYTCILATSLFRVRTPLIILFSLTAHIRYTKRSIDGALTDSAHTDDPIQPTPRSALPSPFITPATVLCFSITQERNSILHATL